MATAGPGGAGAAGAEGAPGSRDPWLEAAVFILVFGIYAATVGPSLGWLDSPELIASSATLGILHSPGHPLASLLGKAALLLPVGDAAFRVNLASALCSALAAAILAGAARRLVRRAAPIPAPIPALIGAAVALAYAFGWAAWAQAVRAEVYGLAALLGAGVIACVLAWDERGERRHLCLAGLLGGLALANHHVTALLLLLPAAALVLLRGRGARPSVAAATSTAVLGIVGLAGYLYLPVRALAHPLVDWGAPRDAARLLWTVSGAAFAKNLGGGHTSGVGGDLAQVVAALVDSLGAPLTVLALIGLATAPRRGLGRVAGFLVAAVIASAVGRALFGFDPETPDHHAYLLPAMMALAVAAGLGAAAVASAFQGAAARGPRAVPRGVGAGIVAVGAALLVAAQLADGRRAGQTWAYAADDLAHAELDRLPPRAVVITTYFQSHFRALALRATEGFRPDLALLDRGNLTYPGAADEAVRRDPDLAALIRAPLVVGAASPLAELDRVAAVRPIAVELDPTIDPALAARLLPGAGLARYLPAPPDDDARRRGEADDQGARRALAAAAAATDGDDRSALEVALLWRDVNRARYYCAFGRRAAAARSLADARRLAPDDDALAELTARCAPQPP